MPDINLGRIGFVPRGDYQTDTIYKPLDAVRHGNKLWVCLAQTATAPSGGNAAWKLLLQGVSESLVGIEGSANAIANTLALRYTDGRLKAGAAVTADDAVTLAQMLAFPAVGGGLSVSGGHVYVDFGQMPTDKFEEMLKSIRVPIWLSANKTWFVRTDGSDANDGSANDAAHAFRTIQAALNFLSANYNIGNYTATVIVQGGTYARFTLPKYTGGLGKIVVSGESKSTVIIDETNASCVLTSTSGEYTVENMTLRCTKDYESNVNYAALWVFANSTIKINNIDFVVNESVVHTGTVCGICCTKGAVEIRENCTLQLNGLASGSRLRAMYLYASGSVALYNDLVINGTCENVCICDQSTWTRSSADPVITGTVVGKRYNSTNYGTIQTRGGGASYFPGSVAGTTSDGRYL